MDTKDKNILFFDGVCHLCNNSVDFLISQKSPQSEPIFFAPLQGVTSSKMISADKRQALDSLVYLRKGVLLERSTAILWALKDLGGLWSWVAQIGLFIPQSLRDSVYNFIAKNRYSWFGKEESCRLPTPSERSYYLD